jgi:23S rRNA pseudouridine1911/1915/1917 synthase
MTTELAFTVPATSAGERLDRFLAAAQPDLSRSRLQALIRAGRVRVRGLPARASQRVHPGEAIVIDLPPPRVSRLEPEALPLAILYEDRELLIVDKPAGVVVHPGAGVSSGTLVHALLHHAPEIAGVGGEGRPGIVHRIDKETSGLLVVARTERAYRVLVEAMRRREVRRVYRALIWGDPRVDRGEFAGPIGRDPRERKRMAVVTRGGKPARTLWAVERRFGIMTLVRVRLETGRTHQIRVHFAHDRHPVVGDPVYGGRHRKLLSLPPARRSLGATVLDALARQALHASELELVHPESGERLRFRSPLPSDFARALELLEAHAHNPRG